LNCSSQIGTKGATEKAGEIQIGRKTNLGNNPSNSTQNTQWNQETN
jgi:hypothetical protein